MGQGNKILEHVKNIILSSTVESTPFPHTYIKGIFPLDFYRQLLCNLPADDSFECTQGYENRLTLRVKNLEHLDISNSVSTFWGNLEKTLCSREVSLTLIELFDAGSYNTLCYKLVPELFLTRDKCNYSIGPHTDIKSKFITTLFYLPENDELIEWGTTLYAPKDKNKKYEQGSKHYPFEGFDLQKQLEFRPNVLFAFVPSEKSFHGVENMDGKDNTVRNLMVLNIYLRKRKWFALFLRLRNKILDQGL